MGGAALVCTTSKEIQDSMKSAHKKYHDRKVQEEAEQRMRMANQQRVKEIAEREKQEKEELLKKQGKRTEKLDKQDENLKKDEKEAARMFAVAEQMLANGNDALSKAIAKNDNIAIASAQGIIQEASKKLHTANTHRSEQVNARQKIGDKRKKQASIMFTKLAKKD